MLYYLEQFQPNKAVGLTLTRNGRLQSAADMYPIGQHYSMPAYKLK